MSDDEFTHPTSVNIRVCDRISTQLGIFFFISNIYELIESFLLKICVRNEFLIM